MRDFARHGAIVLAGTLFANVMMYASYALVQHALGVAASGLFMALIAASQFCSVPAFIAGSVVTWLSGHAAALQDLGSLRSLSSRISVATVFFFACAALVTPVATAWIQSYFHATSAWDVYSTVGITVFFSALTLQRAVFQGSGRFGLYLGSTAVEAVLKFTTGLYLIASHASVTIALIGFFASTVVAYLLSAIASRRLASEAVAYRLPPHLSITNLFTVALPNGSLNAMTFADTILTRHFLTSYASGLYGIVALLGRAILTVTSFVPTVLLPKAIETARAGRSPRRLLLAAVGSTAAASLPALLALALFPNLIVNVLGGRSFYGAIPQMLAYGFAMMLLALATTLTTYLIAIHRLRLAMAVSVAAVFEISAIALFHPNVESIVRIVLIGHASAAAVAGAATIIASVRMLPRTEV